MFLSWLRRRPNRPSKRCAGLRLEPLEDRLALTTLVVLTKTGLSTFDSATPGLIDTSVPIKGLRTGESVVAIDGRPATGELYGLTNQNRLYTLDPYTGAATRRPTLRADDADTTNRFTRLMGTRFSIDFNPTLDRLTIVSDKGQNLSVNVDTGDTITDTGLAYRAGDANQSATPSIVSIAYDNNDNDSATDSTLYDIDSALDVLARQIPPSGGTLLTTGSLGIDVPGRVGFDIDASGNEYVVAIPNRGGFGGPGGDTPAATLYNANLDTGRLTSAGALGTTSAVLDMAALLPAQPVYALTSTGRLAKFNSARPEASISSTVIRGLRSSETLVGIDFRPSTGDLYGFGSTGGIYVIDTRTAVATLKTTLIADPTDTTSPFTQMPLNARFGVDFDPETDELRIVIDDDRNWRVNVDTGVTFTGDDLAYVGSTTDPNVIGSAYSDNFPGATTLVLFGIDSGTDALVTQDSDAGTLTTVGTVLLAGTDFTDRVGFDFTAGGVAYAALQVNGETASRWYQIDLTAGTATEVGRFPDNTLIDGIAIAPPLIELFAPGKSVRENFATARILVRRSGDTTGPASVNYATADGTALAGSDYMAATGMLSFEAGDITKAIVVAVVNDRRKEATEYAFVELSLPAANGNVTLKRRIGLLSIQDND